MRPTPRGRAGPRRATSSTSRPASRRASSRSRASVALRHVGEQRQRLVRVARHQLVERRLVELADLGRHLVEAGVPGQLAPRHRRAPGLVDRLAPPAGPSFRAGKPPSGRGFSRFAPSPSRAGRLRPNTSPQLGDDLLGRAQAALAQPHPAGQGDEHGVEPDRRRGDRLLAERRQRRDDGGRVERAAHRRPDAQVRVVAGAPDELDDPLDPHRVGAADRADDDRLLLLRRLVVDAEPAHAVVDGAGDPRRADGVERVHRRDEPEAGVGDDPAQAAGRAARARSSR